ncbi:hypothetical protein [Pseudophaeobacter sp.]|jgi:chromosome segregation ATPase|uniref:hypothetical protein n=1 Tax=Pseudophaeobacter sp. TaxID=1971739 RepID=UPI0025EEFDFE|nr:hypothetical protein [uncultured Pseudophaeobacter sp.]
MTRILVQFLAGYSRYNKGETAAFDEKKAKQLCAGASAVARLVGPVKQVTALTSEGIDLLESDRQELAQAGENMADQLASVERREEELLVGLSGLEARARDLAAREAALLGREEELQAALDAAVESVSEEEPAKTPAEQIEPETQGKGKAPGAPPKQGAKS